MNDNYFTIKQNGTHEIEIKKSTFICSLKRVYSEEEAKIVLAESKKKYWKANHNCSAFIIGKNSEIQRSSDDGEPSGTAGIPMLEVLKKNEVVNVIAIVTRYFGGTKLGSGGLIRAYSQSVSQTLAKVGLVEGKLQQEIFLKIDYSNLKKSQNFLESNHYFFKDILYTENVTIICIIDLPLVTFFIDEITQQLNGQVIITKGEKSYQEIPYQKN